MPADLEGVRTVFKAFHHFPPEAARSILADAVAKRRAIAIVEGTNSRAIGVIAVPLQLPAILLFTPFVRPFRWSRLLLTDAVPLIPLVVLFDGTVSFLRVYLEDDLRRLVRQVPDQDRFNWEIGSVPLAGTPIGLTYLIGTPK